MYPLSKFTGHMQTKERTKAPNFPTPAGEGKAQMKENIDQPHMLPT